MLKGVSNIVAVIFHPLFIPFYGVIIMLLSNPYRYGKINDFTGFTIIANVFLNTVMFPLILLGLLKALGILKDLQMKERAKRLLPYMVMIFFYFWTFLIFKKQIDAHTDVDALLLGASFSAVAGFLINVVWFKVSMHTIAFGNLFVFLLYVIQLSEVSILIPFLIVIFIGGLVGTTRLVLNAHEPIEVNTGYVVGFLCQIAAFIVLL